MTVSGSGPLVRNPSPGGDGTALRARFVQIQPPQVFATGTDYLKWDVPTGTGTTPGSENDFDDIGFITEYNTLAGYFWPPFAGDYDFHLFVELDPPTDSWDAGDEWVVVLTAAWGFGYQTEQVSQAGNPHVDVNLGLHTYRRVTQAQLDLGEEVQFSVTLYGGVFPELTVVRATLNVVAVPL